MRPELSQLYQLLIELDSVRLGRATALLFLTDPNGVLQVILRGIVRRLGLEQDESKSATHTHERPSALSQTAVRDKARAVRSRDPEKATALEATEDLLRAAITALLHHSKDLLRPIGDPEGKADRREAVSDLLQASRAALEVAIDAKCKKMLHGLDGELACTPSFYNCEFAPPLPPL